MENVRYYFILGSNPALSLSELSACFNKKKLTLAHRQIALYQTDQAIDAAETIRRLGGTVKIGLIMTEASPKNLFSAISPLLKPGEGKYYFGFSDYGVKPSLIKPLAMNIKKELQARGVSARWVVSREETLSSVVVEQNNLLTNGAEFVLIASAGKILIGKTLAVQPFKELSRRDYGRPLRDDQSGMLPPKLAQIMINLARAPKGGMILDPFCGSGTILTEALLMGYENLIGSDISEKAIINTKKNLEWIILSYELRVTNYKLQIADAMQISKNLEPDSIDAIVTEPYLGPQRGKVDTRRTVKELENLYAASLQEFYKILKPGGRIVMVWPIFNTAAGRILLSQKIINNFKLLPPLDASFNKFPGLSDRQTLVYGRPSQKVWREIIILEK